jgi:hypothetical protein
MLLRFACDKLVKVVDGANPRDESRRMFAADFDAPNYESIEAL